MQALSISNLKKVYSNGTQALKGIDLDVADGDFFALLGPNGAGKSTAIGIITSLVNKTSGTVEVFGKDLDQDRVAVKRSIGVVPQEFNFSQFEPPEQILMHQAGFYGMPHKEAKKRAQEVLSQLQLSDKSKVISRTLSGGMKRRLMIARALMHKPKLLILDEPTAGVDIEIRRSMWDFLIELNEQGTTIVLTTHYLEEAENLCRNIAIIDHGEIKESTNMKTLLAKLDVQIFVLDVEQVDRSLQLENIDWNLREDGNLEVSLNKEQHLNDLYAQLTAKGIQVNSMRPKTNRLEELFVRLTNHSTNA